MSTDNRPYTVADQIAADIRFADSQRRNAIGEHQTRHADKFREAIDLARLHFNEAYPVSERGAMVPCWYSAKVVAAFDTLLNVLKLNPPV